MYVDKQQDKVSRESTEVENRVRELRGCKGMLWEKEVGKGQGGGGWTGKSANAAQTQWEYSCASHVISAQREWCMANLQIYVSE